MNVRYKTRARPNKEIEHDGRLRHPQLITKAFGGPCKNYHVAGRRPPQISSHSAHFR